MRAPSRLAHWLPIAALAVALAAPLSASAEPSISVHDPFHEPGRFTVKNLQLEGRGNNLVLTRGGRVNATLDVFQHCRDCGGSLNQIIVSVAGDRDAQACVWSGGARSNGWEATRFTLDVPDAPGVYEVRARYAQARSCRDALRWWRTDRPDGPNPDSTIGIIIIEGEPEPEPAERPLREIRADLDRTLAALDEASTRLVELADKRLDGKRQRRVLELSVEVQRLSRALRALNEELEDAVRRELGDRRGRRERRPRFERPRVVVVAAPEPDFGPRPMAPREYDALLRRIDDATFSDAQKNALRDEITAGSFFLVRQALGVIEKFPHDSDKVDAAVLLCPVIVEARALPELLGAMTFESSRDDLRRRTKGRCGLQP